MQMQDYLTCMMTSLISESTKEVEHYMDQGKLDAFNQALDAIYSQLSYRCEAWNALNETQVCVTCDRMATSSGTCPIPDSSIPTHDSKLDFIA